MGSKYLFPGVLDSSKSNKLVAITGGLPPIIRFMTKQKSVRSNALIMPLTGIVFCPISRRIISVIIGLFFQKKKYFHNKIPR